MSASTLSSARPMAAAPVPAASRRAVVRALYSRYGAVVGYAIAAAVTYAGWTGRAERNIDAGQGLGYALGIIGASLLPLVFEYLRYRLRRARA